MTSEKPELIYLCLQELEEIPEYWKFAEKLLADLKASSDDTKSEK